MLDFCSNVVIQDSISCDGYEGHNVISILDAGAVAVARIQGAHVCTKQERGKHRSLWYTGSDIPRSALGLRSEADKLRTIV